MTQVVDCQRCGASLSYGEVFRHQLAQEVAGGRPASKQILGDRLSPRKPKAMCGACRTHAQHELPAEAPAKSRPWLMPVVAAVGVLLIAAVLRVR
jgi:hypothetical protein